MALMLVVVVVVVVLVVVVRVVVDRVTRGRKNEVVVVGKPVKVVVVKADVVCNR